MENCVRACQAATDDSELLKQVSAAASVVSQALHDLLQHVRQFASRGEPIGRYDQATDTIMCVTESIFSSMGDAGEGSGCGGGWSVWGFLRVMVRNVMAALARARSHLPQSDTSSLSLGKIRKTLHVPVHSNT